MGSRFDNVELKINKAVLYLKEKISKEKVTTKRFWIGISVPAFISIVGVCIQLFK